MIAKAQYFFLTSLPSLPALGEKPPIRLEAFAERAEGLPGVPEAVAAVMLEHDLMQRASVLAGERDEADPVVLTPGQGRGEEPLPPYLQAEGETARPIGDDATWEMYYRHVAEVGGKIGSVFLREWAGFEVTLRNELVAARAKVLDLAPDEYFVAAELTGSDTETARIVAQWSSSADPFEAQRVLDQGRWDWLAGHAGWFSFRVDEAAAYARGLVLLHRWQSLKQD
jgi:hypothetical protein